MNCYRVSLPIMIDAQDADEARAIAEAVITERLHDFTTHLESATVELDHAGACGVSVHCDVCGAEVRITDDFSGHACTSTALPFGYTSQEELTAAFNARAKRRGRK